MEWLLFRTAMISSAVKSCGQKRLRIAAARKKRAPWWNHDVKEAIYPSKKRKKKDSFKALLQNRSSSDLQSPYSEARKAAAQVVEISKERFWEEFGRRLDSNYSSANKVY